ncbi:hypothetical protein [Proteiniclasticum sp.]|uniref:hypothetical protein n=1 Tax=Proteiniclasticum sp. TaxID=2053595 RepID=UPI00289ED452|nr:hypothetical protein [Proteiniclasticum sp.]
MKYLCTAFDVAVYIKTANFPIKQEYGILESIWERREELLAAKYKAEKKQFLNLIRHEMNKLDGSLDYVDEINYILKEMGSKYLLCDQEFEQDVIASYFKVIKIQLLLTPGKKYCRIKLRTIIRSFGYKRRTASLVEYMNKTINALGLKTYVRGLERCNIRDVSLDQVIIVRLKNM